ncbi:RDD family protein [Micromonospora sp. DR5-3]|uniref:RDD family protein n=1 Tax=unclassified Micromonospora TaxID=2617518 RepID=UPI0011D99521|nr:MULTISPECIES: RDD family protein [unclassified Micromonospora]MCW3813066.1 RDD family protein [Micromonospora sp. DR5-3]TYC25949.1 RDD family protein [Micromonospora sp. MP36]
MSVTPGWYVDPADPETRRYWDGEGWIGAPIPVDATPPEGPPPPEPAPAAAPAPTTPAPHPGPPAGPHPGQPVSGPYPGQPAAGPYPGQQPVSGPYPGQPAGGPAPWPGQPTGPGQPAGPPPGWPYPTWPVRPPAPRPHGLPLASYGARLVARLIDIGVVFLLNVVVNGWFVWRYFEEISPYLRESVRRSLAGNTSTEGLPQPGEQAAGLQIAILLIATALWYAYEVPSMAARGQTFGKRVMGVRAVPVEADQPLGFGRATRRWSTLGLPTLLWYCCGFGLLLQFVDAVSPLFDQPLRQALHDKRAQTVVVQLPRTRPDTRTASRDSANPPGDTP